MWEVLGPLLGAGGAIGLMTLLARVFLTLHRDAIAAEQRRADAAERRAEAAEKRAEVREAQIATLLGRPKGTP